MAVSKKLCLYHKSDLDGQCSAAIWKDSWPNGLLVGMTYGQTIDAQVLADKDVTVLDLSLTAAQLKQWAPIVSKLTWIDHHKSSIDVWGKVREADELKGTSIRTVFSLSKAACELTWGVCCWDKSMPETVQLLGDYDAWRHSNVKTLPFQMGMRLDDWNPDTQLAAWQSLFKDNGSQVLSIVENGKLILKYVKQQNARGVKAIWFPVQFAGKQWMAANQGGINSYFWDAVWQDQFDGRLAFVRSRHHWTVSLYSDTCDCSKIARAHGGGGHVGAAGFQCQSLPFEFPEENS